LKSTPSKETKDFPRLIAVVAKVATATIFVIVESSVPGPIKGWGSKSPFDVMVCPDCRLTATIGALHGYFLPKVAEHPQEEDSVNIDVLS